MQQGTKQLLIQTVSLVAGFMAWVLLSSLIPFITTEIKLTSIQIIWVTASPFILGALLRIPIGYWASRYGARTLFTISFIILLVPIAMISYAKSFPVLLFGGILLGIGGSIFSIGVTSLPKYFSKDKQGFINGLFGVGNIGTAITPFFAPVLADAYGWRATARIFLFMVLFFALLNLVFGDHNESKTKSTLTEQIQAVYKKPKLWLLCLFYFITFGSFVAFTICLPSFLVQHFELERLDIAVRTAGFIAIGTLMRPVGGWFSDKINPFLILTGAFLGLTLGGFLLSFPITLPFFSFGSLLIAFCAGIGNGVVFKLVPLYFPKQAGIVNGIISAIGLGGFFPAFILAILFQFTGQNAIGFMSLSELSLACFILDIWLYFHDKLEISSQIVDHAAAGICVTDRNGIIQKVNPAFTRITGYTQSEVTGKTPSVLQSGEHDIAFYKNMWDNLLTKGYWEGYIWNKRKNQDIYQEWLTITAIRDETGETKNYVGMFREKNDIQ